MVAHPSIKEPEPTARGREADRTTAAAAPAPMSSHSPGGMEHDMPARGARVISPSLLVPGEIIIFEIKPSRWYIFFVAMQWLAAGLALMLLGLYISELPREARSAGIVIGSSVVGLRMALALFQWHGRTYVLTDRRVLMQSGVFNVSVESVGLEEVSSTFVAQAAGQRLLGIANIFFRCSLVPRNCLVWEHLTRPQEVHAVIIAQIDRWKRTLAMTKTL